MLSVLSILLLAAAPDEAAASEPFRPYTQTFIAPSGEPFRAHDGEPYPMARWFAGADANGDGQLDFAEFDADFQRFVAELDVNRDGSLDGIERARYENEVAPETMSGAWDERLHARNEAAREVDFGGSDQGASTVMRPEPGYSNTSGAAQYDLLGLPEPVAAMDVMVHGRITRADAQRASRERFDRLDTPHRGYLTLDSLPQTYAEMGGRKKRKKRR